MAEDLISRTRHELEARIAELESAVQELPRLKAALEALTDGKPAQSRRRSVRPSSDGSTRARQRRPRGANRAAVLKVIHERPGVSVGEVANLVAKKGVKKNVVYVTISKLSRDGVIAKSPTGELTAPSA
jgi:hypothetical protein